MRKRKAAHAVAASRRAGGPALGGSALALLVMTWTGAPGYARADTIVLKSGEAIEGSIIDATRNTVIVQREVGGMRQMPIRDIAQVRIELAQGRRISGQLLSWADGVYQVRSGGQVMRIAEGDILSREAGEEAPAQAQRERPQRPIGPQTVRMAAAPATAAPEETAADRAAPAREQMAAPTPEDEKRSPAAGEEPGAAASEEQSLAAADEEPSATGGEEPTAPEREEQSLAAADEEPSATGGAEPSAAGGEEQSLAAADEKPSATGGEEPSAAGREEQNLAAADEEPSATGGEEPAAAGGEEQSLAAADEKPSATGGEEPSAAGREEQNLAAADEEPSATGGEEPAAAEGGEEGRAAGEEQSLAAVDEEQSPTAGAQESLVAVKASVDPAEPGADQMVFRIELSRPAEQTLVLIYGTVEGTAKAGEDFEPQQGIVTLAPGSESAEVHVPLIESPSKGEKRFELFLTADPKVAAIVDRRIIATINGDD